MEAIYRQMLNPMNIFVHTPSASAPEQTKDALRIASNFPIIVLPQSTGALWEDLRGTLPTTTGAYMVGRKTAPGGDAACGGLGRFLQSVGLACSFSRRTPV